jgi:hypothetical protein
MNWPRVLPVMCAIDSKPKPPGRCQWIRCAHDIAGQLAVAFVHTLAKVAAFEVVNQVVPHALGERAVALRSDHITQPDAVAQ